MKIKLDKHQAQGLADLLTQCSASPVESEAMLQIYTLRPLVDRLNAGATNLRLENQKFKTKLSPTEIIAMHFLVKSWFLDHLDPYVIAFVVDLSKKVDEQYNTLKNNVYASI